MFTRKLWPMAIVALALVAVLVGVSLLPQAPATAAPAAIPTPASVTRPAQDGYITFNPFSASAVTADSTSTCFDVGNYSVIDALYVIDQGTTNTVTLTSKWSVDGTTTASGINLVASNVADATDMAQLQVFGRYWCVLADVTNANPLTVTVQAIAK